MSRSLVGALGLVVAVASAVRAESGAFDTYALSVPHPVRSAVFAIDGPAEGGRSLLVAGVDEGGEGQLSVFPVAATGKLAVGPARTVALPRDILALEADGDALYALTPAGVSRWRRRDDTFAPVVASPSIFQLRPLNRLVAVSFLSDIDGDGDSDIVLPGFGEYRLFVQEDRGKFRPADRLAIPAIAVHQAYNRRITYRPVPVYFLDANADGKRDGIAVRGSVLLFFRGRGAGRFDTGRALPTQLGITERFLGDEMGDVDHTDQIWKRVVRVGDFEGDGTVDLFTHSVESTGLFDKAHVLQLHRGLAEEPFTYREEPEGRIDTNVVIDTPNFADVNDDGRLDFATWSVDFGLGTVVGWLLTGTVDLDVSYYALREDGTYPKKPDRREEVEAAFDLSSGKPTVPPWLLADVNADGRADLILGEGEDRLRVFLGDGSPALFTEEAVVTRVRLPGNGRDLVDPLDVNGDGREDLVLRYGAVDGENSVGRLRVLIAQGAPVPPEAAAP